MTSAEIKKLDALILQVGNLEVVVSELSDAITARPSIEPPPPEGGSVWDGFSVDSPLAEYLVTDAGWRAVGGALTGYPGDKAFFQLGVSGVSPDGRVLHGGDPLNAVASKSEGLLLKALAENTDSNLYASTQWGKANIPPTVATVLMCLRCVNVEHARQFGLSSAGLVPAEYTNVTSLQALYDLLVARSQGTGSVSGDPFAAE